MNKIPSTAARIQAGLARRHSRERRFRLYGAGAIILALAALAVLFVSIGGSGLSALRQTEMQISVFLDESIIDPAGARDIKVLSGADYQGLVKKSLRDLFPDVKQRRDKGKLYNLVSSGAGYEIRKMVLADPSLIGQNLTLWVPTSDDVDQAMKGKVDWSLPESNRQISDKEWAWIQEIAKDDRLELRFNNRFFINADSREPELAGVLGAVMGSFISLMVCLVLAFPLGVMTAIYLEEFAPKNRWSEIIEVNINNLAAVPSIVFGLLGLAVLLGWFGMPRSAPLVGGMVLVLMTLPTIIISGRAALKAVPPSIRQAALGLGASPLQAVFHHVLPAAMPGMLTGTIIGMAQALGETAPLLMIGMVAFIVDVPTGLSDPATALPVQIFLWADSPERAFTERTAAAILVLLSFLISMNLVAIILRRRFEQRW